MLLRRILLWPFATAYGLVLVLRHALYDQGILRSTRPDIPTIAIGNLALGGTGKTPLLELVLRTLDGIHTIATLSRGYGRKGIDIHEVEPDDTAEKSGDEPLQVKRKFPDVRVFVGADRVKAIEHIQAHVATLKAVVLDDALQHRRLNAGLNILLSTWARPYCDDALVPAGMLRDLRSRAVHAQIVILTKCPVIPDEHGRAHWRKRLGLKEHQHLFFASIQYDEPEWFRGTKDPVPQGQHVSALLFTGIADPDPLVMHVRYLFGVVDHVAFPDHHSFTASDLGGLAARYANFAPGPNILVTTEKDAARLRSVIDGSPLEGMPIVVIGMRAIILNEPKRFNTLIRDHVTTHTAHR